MPTPSSSPSSSSPSSAALPSVSSSSPSSPSSSSPSSPSSSSPSSPSSSSSSSGAIVITTPSVNLSNPGAGDYKAHDVRFENTLGPGKDVITVAKASPGPFTVTQTSTDSFSIKAMFAEGLDGGGKASESATVKFLDVNGDVIGTGTFEAKYDANLQFKYLAKVSDIDYAASMAPQIGAQFSGMLGGIESLSNEKAVAYMTTAVNQSITAGPFNEQLIVKLTESADLIKGDMNPSVSFDTTLTYTLDSLNLGPGVPELYLGFSKTFSDDSTQSQDLKLQFGIRDLLVKPDSKTINMSAIGWQLGVTSDVSAPGSGKSVFTNVTGVAGLKLEF